MTDKNEIYNELQSIYAILPAEEYPKMYDYITAMLADEESMDEPYDLAVTLAELDKPVVLPKYIIDFITELFEGEREKGKVELVNSPFCGRICNGHGFVGLMLFYKIFSEYQKNGEIPHIVSIHA